MGAAFSPTIANIYMSTIVTKFLQSQENKPLTFSRYIDDIFMIWTSTSAELDTFITNLNAVHPNLKFTHECSTQSIDFLDLTIYKGSNFLYTNILDIKTFQKPLNLYQYLHFSSNHPSKVFKAIIKGECIRFARTNTTEEGYASTVHLFTMRLHKRGFPTAVINKTTCTIKYDRRQHYLKHGQRPQPTSSPPIFKTVPPPQFHRLKQLILEDYNKLRFITPRIIAMRHPTLSNILVRAKLTPTDDQFLDMLLHLNNTNTTMHLTAATLPKLKYNCPKITPCRHPTCCTCAHHLLCTPALKGSHKNADTYFIRHQFSCTTTLSTSLHASNAENNM